MIPEIDGYITVATTALKAVFDESEMETAVSDLLGDLMHYCDHHDLDFDAELGKALDHYTEEILELTAVQNTTDPDNRMFCIHCNQEREDVDDHNICPDCNAETGHEGDTNDKTRFENIYDCPCGCHWFGFWSCACDDRCPKCSTSCSPTESIEKG